MGEVPYAGESLQKAVVHRSEAYTFTQEIIRDGSRIVNLKKIEYALTRPILYVSKLLDDLNLKENSPSSSHNSPDSLQSRIKSLIDHIQPYIYGGTPMCKAMKNALHIFQRSFTEKKVLFILSDGQAADGDPCPLGAELARLGVRVVTCFLTDECIKNPRSLFDTESDAWDKGEKSLFEMSAVMRNTDPPVSHLTDYGWTLPASGECRLFVQANSLDLVDELCRIVVAELTNPCDALLDILEKVPLGTYINQENAAFKPVKQVGGTCYAHAVATVFHLAMLRIVGREDDYSKLQLAMRRSLERKGIEPTNFQEIKERLIVEYGTMAASTKSVLTEVCPEYRLHFQEVNEVHARQALNHRRPLVATFSLKNKQKFEDFFKHNPKGILQRFDIEDGSPGSHAGHAVVLIRCSPACLVFINSWGQDFADGGFFRVKDANVLDDMTFYDVFWTPEDLKQSEKDAYKRKAAQRGKELAEIFPSVYEMPSQCPSCEQISRVNDFKGDLLKTMCPKCGYNFQPTIDDLAKSLYL